MIRVLLIFFVLFNAGLAFAGEKLKVVTTFTVIADIARNVAGDAAQVISITKPVLKYMAINQRLKIWSKLTTQI